MSQQGDFSKQLSLMEKHLNYNLQIQLQALLDEIIKELLEQSFDEHEKKQHDLFESSMPKHINSLNILNSNNEIKDIKESQQVISDLFDEQKGQLLRVEKSQSIPNRLQSLSVTQLAKSRKDLELQVASKKY